MEGVPRAFPCRSRVFILVPQRPSFTTAIAASPSRHPLVTDAGKGKSDAIKAKLYGRYGKRIQQLAMQGRDNNPALADLLDQARSAGVPRDVIERNLAKAEQSDVDFKEAVYEAYGPGGTGFLIECLTDNLNRSVADVKMAVTKQGLGKWAESGSVAFSFNRVGLVVVGPVDEGGTVDEDALFEAAADFAEDVVPSPEGTDAEGSFRVTCTVENFSSCRAACAGVKGVVVDGESSGIVYLPATEVEVNDEDFAACELILERLLAVDDVDCVTTTVAGLEPA